MISFKVAFQECSTGSISFYLFFSIFSILKLAEFLSVAASGIKKVLLDSRYDERNPFIQGSLE